MSAVNRLQRQSNRHLSYAFERRCLIFVAVTKRKGLMRIALGNEAASAVDRAAMRVLAFHAE